MGFYSECFRFEGGGRHNLGLKRTGKSCRLRWVNYLHPDLKRGKMTPHEEKLVLELHSQFGNRWSRIARKMPGRTDNEIKNYWRTHMRKKAQEKKTSSSSSSCVSPSSPSSNCSSPSSSSSNNANYKAAAETTTTTTTTATFCLQDKEEVYSMDEIWKDITSSEETIKPMCSTEQASIVASPLWDYCPDDTLWKMDDDEIKMFNFPFNDLFLPC